MQFVTLVMMSLMHLQGDIQPVASSSSVQLLSPSEMALVCPGQPLSLTCCANQSTTLRWIILLPHINDPYVQNVITIGDGSIPLIELEVAGRPIALNFLRQSTNPLTSMLSINNTVTGLNGTRINCSTGDSSEMTIIHIIGPMYQPASGQINQADYFGMDKVTVILEWIPAEHDAVVNITVYYYIIVDPWLPTDLKSPVNPFRWNLTLSYNISYSVSVLSSICGHNNIIANMTLKYVTCESLMTELVDGCYDPTLQIMSKSYMNRPALSGDNITFQCSSGLVLVGPSSSMCTDEGQWEPHPRVLRCTCVNSMSINANCDAPSQPSNGYIFPYTDMSMDSTVTFVCDRSESAENFTAVCMFGNWEPDPLTHCKELSQVTVKDIVTESRSMKTVAVAVSSSVIAFLIASIMFFITGFACGYCFSQKFKQSSKETPHPTDYPPSTSHHPAPLYEELQLSAEIHQEQDVDLKENVAYGQSKSIIARHK